MQENDKIIRFLVEYKMVKYMLFLPILTFYNSDSTYLGWEKERLIFSSTLKSHRSGNFYCSEWAILYYTGGAHWFTSALFSVYLAKP